MDVLKLLLHTLCSLHASQNKETTVLSYTTSKDNVGDFKYYSATLMLVFFFYQEFRDRNKNNSAK